MDYIQVIIQGGSVGIALVALWITYKLIGNHLTHSTEAIEKLTMVLTRVEELLRDKLK